MKEKPKIFVAMSGGVDSSVAAALLKRKGCDVYGVFIKGWYPSEIPCTWREDRRDAMRVAALLDIPFYTFDFGSEYKKYVIDYLIREYKAGRTPNPDVMCNKYIKFDLFLKKARMLGADFIATGHYVKKLEGKTGIQKLYIAKDKNKDQSYFLWTLNQNQLKYCLFPIGNYLKKEVRNLAKKFRLPVAEKKDSQGLCFVGEFRMMDFLKKYIKPRKGKVINKTGDLVGEHKGVEYYTIGQRHGFKVFSGRGPYYVVGKDLKNNVLIVSEKANQKDFYNNELTISQVNWIAGKLPDLGKKYLARLRYRQPLLNCHLEKINGEKIKVVFEESPSAPAIGQSLVIYKNKELIGGGVIDH